MGMKPKWGLQPHLSNLYWLTPKQLERIYPDYTLNTLKGKRAYWRKKVREGEIPEPPMATPEQEPHQGQIPETGRLKNTWEVAAYDREEGGWVTTTLSSYSHQGSPEEGAEIFEPATPAKITPTKRKRMERLGKQILVFGDSQIGYHRLYDEDGQDYLVPTHSEKALSVLAQINAHEKPEFIYNVSDTVDNAPLGRFDPASDSFHRVLGPSFQRAHDLYAQLRADNPDADIKEVDSNHNARIQKHMMKKYPEWYGFVLPGESYPMISYYRLANLEPLGVEFISGYGGAEIVHGEEYGAPIIFKHGSHSSSNPGATVRKEAQQNPTVNVVRGHGHSYEHITQTTRDGNYLHYIQLGTTCDTKGTVPSYHSSMTETGQPVHRQENWQNQLMMITDYENGTYQFDVIDIVNGIANYRGVRYDGNPEATSK